MGRLGVAPVAAHQVAINIASLTFMVPLGVSARPRCWSGARSARGDAAGGAAPTRPRWSSAPASWRVRRCCCSPRRHPRALYTTDPAVLALAALLIPIAGVFQVFDGLQVVVDRRAARTGDTRAP